MEILDSDDKTDAALFVEFYSKPVQNNFQSTAEGRPIFEDRDYVKIYLPGDKTTVIDTFANQSHIHRFPIQWARYKNKNSDLAEIGTPLNMWPLLTPAKCEELRAMHFKTVESIAHASDAQLQNLGMAAGMSAHTFRERAARYLEAAKGDAFANQQAETAKKLEEENKSLRADMEEMKQMIAQLAQNQKKTPGRKLAQTDIEQEQEGNASEQSQGEAA